MKPMISSTKNNVVHYRRKSFILNDYSHLKIHPTLRAFLHTYHIFKLNLKTAGNGHQPPIKARRAYIESTLKACHLLNK